MVKLRRSKRDNQRSFSENNINNYKSWITALQLPIKKNYNGLLIYHKQLLDHINTYTNITTRRTYLCSLAKLFRVLKGDSSSLYRKYSKMSVELQAQIEKDSSEQKISENRKKNFITLNEVIKRREELKKLFLQKPDDHKLNQQYLLLCLYTMQPPLRMEYKDMKIVQSIPRDKDKNYVLEKDKKYSVIVNNDKVCKHRPSDIFELSPELNEAINHSLRMFPRQYILSLNTNKDKPIGKQSFELLLRGCFTDKRIGVDLLRGAYITHVFDKPGITMKDKEELAKKMRTSLSMASTVYHKVTEKEFTDEELVDELVMKIKNVQDKEQLKRVVLDIINAIRKNESKTRKT